MRRIDHYNIMDSVCGRGKIIDNFEELVDKALNCEAARTPELRKRIKDAGRFLKRHPQVVYMIVGAILMQAGKSVIQKIEEEEEVVRAQPEEGGEGWYGRY